MAFVAKGRKGDTRIQPATVNRKGDIPGVAFVAKGRKGDTRIQLATVNRKGDTRIFIPPG